MPLFRLCFVDLQVRFVTISSPLIQWLESTIEMGKDTVTRHYIIGAEMCISVRSALDPNDIL